MCKAVILAAGKGSRLAHITKQTPKPMILYKNKPLLQYNIELCKSHNITEIFINTHHLSEKITDFFGNGNEFGVHITYSYEPELLGTAGALLNFKDHLQDKPFFVLYGDNVSQFDLSSLTNTPNSIAFHHRDDVTQSGVAEFDANHKITCFIEKPFPNQTKSHWVNAGIYYLNPPIFKYIPQGFSDFGKDIFPKLLHANFPLYGVCSTQKVRAFDTQEMYNHSR